MKNLKRCTSLLLVLAMVLSMVITCASADTSIEASGTTGDCTWTLDSDGTLTISGTGAMENYTAGSTVSWYSMGDKITSVVVEEGVTTIGNWAFANCTNLTSVEIADTVTTIGGYAFRYDSSLTAITLPDNVTSLGTYCFDRTGLTTIVIPDSVTSIGSYLFDKCYSLTTVVLGSGITEWPSSIFYYCSALSELYVRGDEPTSTKSSSLTTYGDSSVSIYYYCGTTWSNVSDGTWTSTATSKVGTGSGALPAYTITMLHDFENYNTELTTATCTEAGVLYCRCGEESQTLEAPLGHSYVGEVTTEPTCGAAGVMTYTCSRCNDSYTEAIEATGNHTWDEGTLTTAPTEETQGVITYICTVCDQTKTEYIDGYELTEDDVAVSFDADTGDYTVTVTYGGEELDENGDYTVSAEIQLTRYEMTITVSGMGLYIGTVTKTLKLPGYSSNVFLVYDEDTLNQALAGEYSVIILTDSFSVSSAVSVNYDATFYGDGYTITAGSGLSMDAATAVLTVGEGATVSLHNLTLSGNYSARIVYAGPNSSVTIGSDVTLTSGSNTGSSTTGYGSALYVTKGAEVTLLGTVKNTGSSNDCNPVYNLGTLAVQDGAYLTNLRAATSAIYNAGTLNWTGGTFDVGLQGYYRNVGSGTNAGAVINNQGTFNLSGGTINGFLDEDETEYTTAYYGAVYNGEGAELTLSGGTITGFNATGAGNNYRSGGGGVHNEGTFTMTGGVITKNTSVYTDSTSMNAEGSGSYGGGVYNAGVFYFTGGEISYNSAALGGGVYNEGAYCPEGNGSNDATTFVGEFYMSDDAALVGNTLTGDTFSTSSSGGMMNNGGVGVKLAGSALCVAGGSTAVISGGSVTGDYSITVDLGSDEDGNAVTETVSAGIAVIPSQATNYSGHDGAGVTVADDSQLTITGSPDIQVGVLLLNVGSSETTAFVTNTDADDFVNDDPSTFEYIVEDVEYSEDNIAYLVLDGGLETKLAVTTVNSYADSISYRNLSGGSGGSVYTTSESSVNYTINGDGDIVAVYTNDRIVVSEDDANLFTLADGIGLYLTTTDITEDDVTTSYDAWAICAHNSLTYVESADATCTEAGHSDYYQCDTCGAMFDAEGNELTEDDVTTDEATGHSLTRVAAKDATCTEVGYSVTHYKCSVCGTLFDTIAEDNELTEADVTIAATGHSWNLEDAVTENVVEATCTTAGSYDTVIYCANCGEELARATTTVPVTGHTAGTAVKENEVAATCTTTGSYDMVTYCEDCGEKLSSYTVTVAATGHTYGEGVQTVAATRYTTGVMSYTCTTCGETFTTKIAKTNASFLFDDVTNSGSYYYTAVYWAYDLGITAGTSATLFSPSASCTRGQFVTFLYRLAQANGADTSVTITGCDFTDVSSSASYYQAMLWAVENEITNGTSSTTFSPSKTITRAQAVTMLYRYEKNIVNGGQDPAVSTTSTNFTDVVAGSSYEDAVLWAVDQKITSGTSDTTFSPTQNCTRAMMVTFLYNYAAIQD